MPGDCPANRGGAAAAPPGARSANGEDDRPRAAAADREREPVAAARQLAVACEAAGGASLRRREGEGARHGAPALVSVHGDLLFKLEVELGGGGELEDDGEPMLEKRRAA